MMKKFKKVFLGLFSILAVCCLSLLLSFSVPTTSDANAAPLQDAVFSYISLSQSGQTIDKTKLKTVTDGTEETTYVITNKSVTITFKPLDYNYYISENTNLDNFYPSITTVTIKKDEATGQFPIEFEYNNSTYYYSINGSGQLFIYRYQITPTSSASVTSQSSSLVRHEDVDENTRNIYIINSYSSNSKEFVDLSDQPTNNCSFEFIINVDTSNPSTSNPANKNRIYTLNFQKPIVNFFNLTKPVVMFNTFGKDEGGYDLPAEKAIAPDQIFKKLQIEFINNEYTEGNPLYFNINFNGFIYNYELFSKVIDGENLLFVNYNDSYSNATESISYNNSKFLATTYLTDSEKNIITDNEGKPMVKDKVYANNGMDFNKFSLIFKNTGRYSIEFYDSTYLLEMTDANYFSTSFFIRAEGEEITPFNNIYIVAETFDDNGEQLEYIVSNSTLNYKTKITVKNLGDFGNNVFGDPITLASVIENIVVKKTDFGIDHVETINTVYTVDQILEGLQNNDFSLEFEDDAYYQVIINPKQSTESGAAELSPLHYVFTIVRFAKTTYTFNDVIYEATTPFRTEIKNYTNPIESSINLSIKFSLSAEKAEKLDKTFVNRFDIKFGVKKVSIEKYTPVPSGEEKVPPGVYLKVFGVGDITAYITYNGNTEIITLNSEKNQNTIDRTEYGVYTIRIVDSMGSEMTETITFKKGLNMSAIIFIVLLSIIGVVIALFILKARGKVATR